jgi:phosphoserine phosphatase RsbU/P
MMAKKPESRIASMTEVVQTLGQIKTALARAEAAPAAADRAIADLTVVLVETSRVQAGIVRRYLQELGIDKIHNAGSGQQAIELAKLHRADVLVCSLHLGDMTGMQLARLLRADTACTAMGFVLTTSGSESEDLTDLRTMPHTVMMPKPFDAQKLAASLAQATGRRVGS